MHLRRCILQFNWPRGFRLAALIMLVIGPSRAYTAQIDSVWSGGVGIWHLSGNWSPATIPTNSAMDTYNVLIDNSDTGNLSIVSLNLSAAIDNLTLDLGDTLVIDNSRILTVVGGMGEGAILNSGLIMLNSTGSLSGITASAGPVTFSGGGTLMMSGNVNNRLIGTSGGSFVNLDNYIQGAGLIGVGVTDFSNAWTIQADEAAGITIDPAVSPFVNTGTLRAANGATLRLQQGSFANDGGLIEALNASRVDLTTATITGGTISTTGSGLVRAVASSTNVLAQGVTPVTNLGNIEVTNGASIRLVGTTFQNAGAISLVSSGFATDLAADGGIVNLAGGGEVVMGNNGSNRIVGAGGGSLVNVDNTIRGAGQICANTMDMTNQADVVADQPSALTIDPAATFTNLGTLAAQGGGTLRLSSGLFANETGLIESRAGSLVELNGATISGGSLQAVDGGGVRVIANSSLNGDVSPVSLACAVEMPNGIDIFLRGSIQNSGSLNLNATGSFTDVQTADGVVTLTGGGIINMTNSSAARIIGFSGGSLINVDNTIRGSGAIGSNTLNMTNQGEIIADQPIALTIDPAASPFVNTGVLRATSGGTLNLVNGAFDNLGGLIEAQNASLVTLAGATISGGELTTGGTGLIRVTTTATFDGTVNIPTNSGVIEFLNDADVIFLSAFENSGTIHLASIASVTDFELHNGPVVLTGGGQVTTSNLTTNRIFGVSGGSLINVDNTISGSGNIGLGITPITNQGSIIANQSVALGVNPDGAIGLNNQGTLKATNAATMTIGAGPFTTSGSVIVNPGASMSRTGAFTQTAGSTIVNGSLSATGPIQIQGGTLSGSGAVTGPVTVGGTTAPGTSAGQLSITGTYTQQSSGTLAIEIGGPTPGTQHDRLAVSGAATLGGTLTIDFINGYTPTIGQSFTVMTYPSRTGAFASVIAPCPAGFGVAVNVLATSVRVDIVAPTNNLGDMNCDCAVSLDDVQPFALALIDASAYTGQHPLCSISNADINMDTTVDGSDITGFVGLLLP